MDVELSKYFETVVTISEETRAAMGEPTRRPKDSKQDVYYVHQDKLLRFPFFKAALRQGAFIEGAEMKINVEEEDPIIFYKLVEYIYEADYSPCTSIWNHLGHHKVRRTLSGSKEELYDPSRHHMAIACGTFVTAAETHELFEATVLVLCLGDRYGIQGLVDASLQKITYFPIGTKEVAVLTKHVLKDIPKSSENVYDFLKSKVKLFRPRLEKCEAFQDLQKSNDILLIQGLLKLLIPQSLPTGEDLYDWQNVPCSLDGSQDDGQEDKPIFYFALCNVEVKLEESIANYGCDVQQKKNPNGALFGAALRREVLITDGKCDARGYFWAEIAN